MSRMNWPKVSRQDSDRRHSGEEDRKRSVKLKFEKKKRAALGPERVMARMPSGAMLWVRASDARQGPDGWGVIPVAERTRQGPGRPRRVLTASELRRYKEQQARVGNQKTRLAKKRQVPRF